MADEFVDIEHSLDMGNVSRIDNLPAPLNDNEPVRLVDLNSAIEGLASKDEARVASIANVNIPAPGTTIDGIVLAAGDRVVLKDQAAPAENGIYIFNGDAVPMTRANDADTGEELNGGIIPVLEGTNAATTWRQTAVNAVIDTDPINFVQFGSGSPPATTTTAGIIALATQVEVDAGTVGNKAVTPETLANATLAFPKKVTGLIGDGSTLVYPITHNLGTTAIQVEVFREANGRTVRLNVERVDANTVNLRFNRPPAANSRRYVIIG